MRKGLFCFFVVSLLVLTSVLVPAQDVSVWLGSGHIWTPQEGNYAVSAWRADWQLKAGFELQTSKHLAFEFAYAQDTLKVQRWAYVHDFGPEPIASFTYRLYDLGVEFPMDAGKWAVIPSLGMTALNMSGHALPGYFAALETRYAFTTHWFGGIRLSYRYLPNVPAVGVANVVETALTAGSRF